MKPNQFAQADQERADRLRPGCPGTGLVRPSTGTVGSAGPSQ